MQLSCHNLNGSKRGWAEFPKGHQGELLKVSTQISEITAELSGAQGTQQGTKYCRETKGRQKEGAQDTL